MTGQVVYKMTGSGNDFVMIDGRWGPGTWEAETVRALCDRRRGVGGDALVIIAPGASPGHIRMTYFNSDGSPAPMCGNAALCATQLARLVELTDASEPVLETEAGSYRVASTGNDRARLGLGRIGPPRDMPTLELRAGERDPALLEVGVPHLVVVVADLAEVAVQARGRELRFHPALGPGGANVNFVASEAASDGAWPMRTYERGVEAETYACGTGAVGAAATLARLGQAAPPLRFRSRTGLEIGVLGNQVLERPGELTDVWIEGEARFLFRAVIDI
jgi:diaminopimelate epimerase